MEIPGWTFMLVGGIVAVISSIIYFKQGTFQLFIFLGIAFLTYGIYKTVIDRMTKKTDALLNKEIKQFGKETKLKDLPIGQQLYYQQHYRNQMQARQENRGPATEYEQHQAYVRQMQGNAPPTQHPTGPQPTARPQQPTHHRVHPQQSQQHTQPHNAAQHSRYATCPRCGAQQMPSNFCMNCGTRMR